MERNDEKLSMITPWFIPNYRDKHTYSHAFYSVSILCACSLTVLRNWKLRPTTFYCNSEIGWTKSLSGTKNIGFNFVNLKCTYYRFYRRINVVKSKFILDGKSFVTSYAFLPIHYNIVLPRSPLVLTFVSRFFMHSMYFL